ncbi:MAG: trehalose 6-phosphate synthase [Spirochaetota bacterium]
MQTLEQFYEFMNEVHTVRHAVVGYYLMKAHTPAHAGSLQKALEALDDLPGGKLDKRLLAGEHEVTVTLDYERSELEKDIFFLDHSDDEFGDHLASRSEIGRDAFLGEVDDTVRFLRSREIANFISDRDGTVNNYCGRYRSSHQSIWNAVYLTRFVRSVCTDPVILTSAPLTGEGLLSLSAMPSGSTLYAGSKGREYQDRDGNLSAMELGDEESASLERINDALRELVSQRRFLAFAAIGSGLQPKFGETTVAKQDIHRSIPEARSEEFLRAVRDTVAQVDPGGTVFGIEDTGKDIEITLKANGSAFSKGDGIRFLDERLELGLAEGPNLICGDTSSDVPMVEEAVRLGAGDHTSAIFVTTDTELRARVGEAIADSHFVSEPDVLVVALHRTSQRKRPHGEEHL